MTFGCVPSLCFDACGGAEAPHEDDPGTTPRPDARCRKVDYGEECLETWSQKRSIKRTEPHLLFDMLEARNRLALSLEMHQSGVM